MSNDLLDRLKIERIEYYEDTERVVVRVMTGYQMERVQSYVCQRFPHATHMTLMDGKRQVASFDIDRPVMRKRRRT